MFKNIFFHSKIRGQVSVARLGLGDPRRHHQPRHQVRLRREGSQRPGRLRLLRGEDQGAER